MLDKQSLCIMYQQDVYLYEYIIKVPCTGLELPQKGPISTSNLNPDIAFLIPKMIELSASLEIFAVDSTFGTQSSKKKNFIANQRSCTIYVAGLFPDGIGVGYSD